MVSGEVTTSDMTRQGLTTLAHGKKHLCTQTNVNFSFEFFFCFKIKLKSSTYLFEIRF